jgi:hypothetical protein
MATIKPPLLKLLNKPQPPSTTVDIVFGRYDITLKTDEKGRPIIFFIGKRLENGKIKGERYARRLVEDENGNLVKDHWDHKGKI